MEEAKGTLCRSALVISPRGSRMVGLDLDEWGGSSLIPHLNGIVESKDGATSVASAFPGHPEVHFKCVMDTATPKPTNDADQPKRNKKPNRLFDPAT
ncbi:hypothetical protein TRIUR3_02588 [Triticum urartu]|uniref:Uncharacterized protein n=1 Tax=Triticum urartu TaxID=4572 RepID=M7Z508_TRIUA|nr:hypothetical protein TRIUR3_02588 [Triticum urartu]